MVTGNCLELPKYQLVTILRLVFACPQVEHSIRDQALDSYRGGTAQGSGVEIPATAFVVHGRSHVVLGTLCNQARLVLNLSWDLLETFQGVHTNIGVNIVANIGKVVRYEISYCSGPGREEQLLGNEKLPRLPSSRKSKTLPAGPTSCCFNLALGR